MDDVVPFLLAMILFGGIAGGVVLLVWLLRISDRVRGIEDRLRPLERSLLHPPAPERTQAPAKAGPVPTAAPAPVSSAPLPAPPTPAPPEVAASPSAVAPPSVAPPRLTPPPPSAAPASAVETFFGGRVLLVIGIVALLIGLGLFLKLAIERGWIRPEARLVVGSLAGIAALFAGDRLRARGYGVFGQALMGGGLGALYLCDAFAAVRYGFYGRPLAFALAGAVAVLGVLLAVRRDAPFLAWLGFTGALLAPAILGRNEDALEGLTLWLVAADLGVAAVLAFRPWHGLDVLAAIATAFYFVAWRVRWFSDERTGAAAACLAALAAVLLVLALGPPLRARRRLTTSFVVLLLALGFPLAMGADLFLPEHRTALGLAALVAAAVVAGGALALRRHAVAGDVAAVEAFAFAAVLAAVPILLEGDGVAPAWAAVGAAAFVAGAATRRPWLAAGGVAATGLAAARVLGRFPLHTDAEFSAFLNGPFLAAVSPCAALAVGSVAIRRTWERSVAAADLLLAGATTAAAGLAAYETWVSVAPPGTPWRASGDALAAATAVVAGVGLVAGAAVRGRPATGGLPVWGPFAVAAVLTLVALAFPRSDGHPLALNALFGAAMLVVAGLAASASLRVRPAALGWMAALVLFFAAVTAEWFQWGEHGRTEDLRRDTRFAAQVGVSASWAVLAGGLVAAGFLRGSAAARWTGIAVFLVTVAKVFLYDLAGLDTAWRVGSFLALGALLVGASWLYQRVRRAVAVPGGDVTPDGGGARPPD